MLTLPICRYRSIDVDGHILCDSKCMITRGRIPSETCVRCPFPNIVCAGTRTIDVNGTVSTSAKELLGDKVEQFLSKVGITKKRVEKWIGRECKCSDRKERLNKLHQWAKDFMGMSTEIAVEAFDKMTVPNCVYLGSAKEGKIVEDGQRQAYDCKIHQICVKEGAARPYASCESCKDKLTADDKKLRSKFLDPLKVYDRDQRQTHSLRNLLAGRPSFLVCGGPSAKELDLTKIEQRGCFSLAINNMAGHYKASAFVCSDPPSKFSDVIWLDPQTMKFIPSPKMRPRRGRLRTKVNGEFKDLLIDGEKISACDCPNVWGFERRAWLQPDETFFTEDSAAWGNHDAGVLRTGEKKTVNTSLLGIRLLYYLGSREIYLIGVDFNMTPGVGLKDNYAFGENRDSSAIESNNNQYVVVNDWLCRMQNKGVFEKFGLKVYNCNQQSRLRAFEYVPFDEAISSVLKDYPRQSENYLNGWYEKK